MIRLKTKILSDNEQTGYREMELSYKGKKVCHLYRNIKRGKTYYRIVFHESYVYDPYDREPGFPSTAFKSHFLSPHQMGALRSWDRQTYEFLSLKKALAYVRQRVSLFMSKEYKDWTSPGAISGRNQEEEGRMARYLLDGIVKSLSSEKKMGAFDYDGISYEIFVNGFGEFRILADGREENFDVKHVTFDMVEEYVDDVIDDGVYHTRR